MYKQMLHSVNPIFHKEKAGADQLLASRAISLTPWLQPGVPLIRHENRFNPNIALAPDFLKPSAK
jgi:hypothetical protein